MISLKNITKDYQVYSRKVTAVKGVSIDIPSGDFLTLKGASGSGKSTLLNIIGLVDTPTAGVYRLNSESTESLSKKERSLWRKRHLGFIFQNFNLIPELSVYENVEIPLLISGEKKKDRQSKINEIIEEVGLADHRRHRPGELSGGQQQRVAIARALVCTPPVIVADEPTANLDTKTGRDIVDLMKSLNEKRGVTFVFATHDELILNSMKTIVHMRDGEIVDVVSRSS